MKKNTDTNKEPKIKELMNALHEGVQSVTTSERWKEVLLFQSKFHNYSFNNTFLIYSQCPQATYVAGFTAWKKLGRYVVKGATGIKIMAPHEYFVTDEETGEEKKKIGFHQTSVFDVSQTDGEPLPELCPELKGDTKELKRFYEIAQTVSAVPVREEKIEGQIKGFYSHTHDYIAIKKGMAVKQKCKTLIHEMAHSMIHRIDDERRKTLSRSDREIEAEGTAFVVLSYFGFDTSEYSFPYVASWASADWESIQKAGEMIQKTSEKIIKMIQQKMKVSEQVA